MNFLPFPSPSMSFLFHVSLLLILLLIGIPPSLTYAPGFWYDSCGEAFDCGTQLKNISYPFWEGDGLYGCGHPDFHLYCFHDDFATIKIMNVTYRVIEIDDNDQTIKIARHDYYGIGGACTPPAQNYNTTVDPTLYEYGFGYSNVTILYGCPEYSTGGFNVSICPINGLSNPGVYVRPGSHGPGICNTSAVVPVETDWVKAGKYSGLNQVLKKGFELKWKLDDGKGEACSECTNSGGKCGYDFVRNRTTCFCPDESFGVEKCLATSPGSIRASRALGSTHALREKKSITLPLGLGLAIAVVVGSTIVVLVMIRCLARKCLLKSMIFIRAKKTKNDLDVDAFIKNNGSLLALKQYNYSDVKKMTKSFTYKLGQGGYGSVYKGKLLDGRLVAVKLLSESKGNGEEFLNEVASISRTSHVNVVSLLGFCYERTKRALIYEFMPNGSLDQFIYLEKSSNTNSQLEWKTLYRIAVGIARGLEYLHIGCNTRILHFDIKPHNILLDEEFCPKISDFGLAKLCQRKESIISMLGARGTAGYIAPEVFSRHFGGVSYKSDVYSYGMMILEIVGGRRNIEAGVSQTSEIYFPHWIFKYLEPASTELRLNRVITEDVEEELARKMILVGLWCIQTKPSDRPSMTRVVEMLEGNIQSLQIPPKPFLSSPRRSPPHHSPTVSESESSSNIV